MRNPSTKKLTIFAISFWIDANKRKARKDIAGSLSGVVQHIEIKYLFIKDNGSPGVGKQTRNACFCELDLAFPIIRVTDRAEVQTQGDDVGL